MAAPDYEAHYRLLQLSFGAGPKRINTAWKRLSKIHHPDQYNRNTKAYEQALEIQKRLNQAKDDLNKWFEINPSLTPPPSWTPQEKEPPKNDPPKEQKKTGWFRGSKPELSAAQNLIARWKRICLVYEISPVIAAAILSFLLVSLPGSILFALADTAFSAANNLTAWIIAMECIFIPVLFCRITFEMEILKFQENVHYFEMRATSAEALEFVKAILKKHNMAILCHDTTYKAILTEQNICVRYAVRAIGTNTIIALEARVTGKKDLTTGLRILKDILHEVKRKTVLCCLLR